MVSLPDGKKISKIFLFVFDVIQRFLHVWHGIDQTIIDNASDEWRGIVGG